MTVIHRLGALCLAFAGCAAPASPENGAPEPRETVSSTTSAATSCEPESGSGVSGTTTACAGTPGETADPGSQNVMGGPLQPCPSRHATGFYRDGYCNTGADDRGVHVVCARVTHAFLEFSRAQGNDLITPRGGFAGLQDGDGWCLCASRWREAYDAGVAPPVVLEATHQAALRTSSLEQLQNTAGR